MLIVNGDYRSKKDKGELMKEERKSIESVEGVGYSRGEAFPLRMTSAYDLEHY